MLVDALEGMDEAGDADMLGKQGRNSSDKEEEMDYLHRNKNKLQQKLEEKKMKTELK